MVNDIINILLNLDIKDILATEEVWKKYKDPFRLLITIIISIRVREEKTIEVSERLFSKYRAIEDIKNSSIDEIRDTIKDIGLFNQKAKWIKYIAEVWDYNKICDEEFIRSLPGVGRKVANLYLSVVCNKDYIAVDTHVHRILNRLGIINTRNHEETEKELYKILDKSYWKLINFKLVRFGRNICKPRDPKCEICPLNNYCKYYKNINNKEKNK